MSKAIAASAFLCALTLVSACSSARKEESTNDSERADRRPPVYFTLIHSHGDNWEEGVPGPEQPGIGEHVKYFSGHLDAGRLLMGGPFTDNSGGMMILTVETSDEAERIANEDPAVKSGLLRVQVRQWMTPLRRE